MRSLPRVDDDAELTVTGPPRDDGPEASEPPTTTYAAGDVVADKYRLDAVLGRGGMGTVWRARNIALDVDVALKLIRRERTSSLADQRFLNEARAAARIRHPSIVSVFDFGRTQRGDPFIVMEVVEGESLAKLLERKVRLDPLTACRLLLPIAHALAAVHRRGVVHRDLKPDNIILAQSEPGVVVPKLVDFGVAKDQEDPTHLTRVGAQIGSPEYMAPEQVRAIGEIDERADVWAFCVVFYEVVTGRTPFTGRSQFELFQAITAASPLPTTELGVADQALWRILEKGLAKAPSERWPAIAALGSALAAFAMERGESTDLTGVALGVAWAARAHALESSPSPIGSAPPVASFAGRVPITEAPIAAPTPRRPVWALLAASVVVAGAVLAGSRGSNAAATVPAALLASHPEGDVSPSRSADVASPPSPSSPVGMSTSSAPAPAKPTVAHPIADLSVHAPATSSPSRPSPTRGEPRKGAGHAIVPGF